MIFNRIIGLFLFVVVVSCSYGSNANELLPMKVSFAKLNMAKLANTHVFTIDQLTTLTADNWLTIDSQSRSLSVKSGINWYKIELENHHFSPHSTYLTLGNSFEIENISLLQSTIDGQLVSKPMTLTSNNVWFRQFLVGADNRVVLFLQISSDNDSHIAVSFVSSEQYHQAQANDYFLLAFVIGGIIFTAIIFAALYTATYDKALGLLSIFFLCRGLLLLVLTGGNLLYFFPENTTLRGADFPILVAASSIFYFLFTAQLFNVKKVFVKGEKALKAAILLLIAYIPISLFISVSMNTLISSIIMILVMLILLVLGLFLHKMKQRLALILTSVMAIQLAFTLVIVGGFYLDIAWFSQRNDLHLMSFSLNTILVVLMICRMYQYQLEDKEAAQREALTNAMTSREAQEQLLQLQADNQEELEQRVQERTLELNIALNELEELNRELEEKNTIDELTGLYNRRFYDQKIVAEFRRSKRNLTPLSLIVADLDFFKKVNDTYGHLAGDQCLSWLAQHIKQSLKRSTDIGCRYGGEEFCLILPDTDKEGAVALAEELRKAVESFDFVYHEQHLSLTISCGIATYQQQEGIEPAHIFCAADKALYQAKRNGRNQIQSHEITPELIIQEH